MMGKVTWNFFILAIFAFTACLAHFPEFCSECEEEVWEEVPCDAMPTTYTTITTSTTSTTAIPPTTTTAISSTTVPTTTTTIETSTPTPIITTTEMPTTTINTTSRPYKIYGTKRTTTSTTPSTLPPSTLPPTTATPDAFKKCYCECKVGCKEFCRKVIINSDPRKQITQITKTAQRVPEGHVEIQHVHQRKFVPNYGNYRPGYGYNSGTSSSSSIGGTNYDSTCSCDKSSYSPPSLYPIETSVQEKNSYLPSPLNYPLIHTTERNTNYFNKDTMNINSYDVDELAKLFQPNIYNTDYNNRNRIYKEPNYYDKRNYKNYYNDENNINDYLNQINSNNYVYNYKNQKPNAYDVASGSVYYTASFGNNYLYGQPTLPPKYMPRTPRTTIRTTSTPATIPQTSPSTTSTTTKRNYHVKEICIDSYGNVEKEPEKSYMPLMTRPSKSSTAHSTYAYGELNPHSKYEPYEQSNYDPFYSYSSVPSSHNPQQQNTESLNPNPSFGLALDNYLNKYIYSQAPADTVSSSGYSSHQLPYSYNFR
ncbi:putative uncharacterized protein DDB_G0272516 [Teleopsis dalmanni]|uniref:putative uncharacterized protein DDB_G0272516 n=1 Tax=Teleopsis dalmanni TaxID=139649 RepID=UPI0018CE07F8|nr:putative uncharacterized protein DDB_G0272516 [Teleopsis dalmanni]